MFCHEKYVQTKSLENSTNFEELSISPVNSERTVYILVIFKLIWTTDKDNSVPNNCKSQSMYG